MGRDHLRLAVWVLAVFTVLGVAGNHTALAASQVNGGGWFKIPCDPFANPSCPSPSHAFDVNFGINARNPVSQGHFNYYNRFTGYHANGVIDTLTFTSPSTNCPNTSNLSATITGHCPDGSCSFFQMELQDNGEPGTSNSQKSKLDSVCSATVTPTSSSTPGDSTPAPAPLNGGNIQVK